MATIIDFRPAEGKTGGIVAGEARRSPCEIVIFPGIRYERWESAAPTSSESAAPVKAKAAKPRRSVKRDRLELED